MRNLGFHHLVLLSGERVGQSVVSVNDSMHVLHWHLLDSEEPFTEWLGGTARFSLNKDNILVLSY